MTVAGGTHDLVLNGQGYMLATGSKGTITYVRKAARVGLGVTTVSTNATGVESLQGTTVAGQPAPFQRLCWSNWSGLGRKFLVGGWQASQQRGQLNDLLRLRPVLKGSALALAPQAVTGVVDPSSPALASYYAASLGQITVVALNNRLFVSANPGTNNTGFVLRNTVASPIQGLTVWNQKFLLSTAAALQVFDPVANTLVAFSSPRTNAELLLSYQGTLFMNIGAALYYYLPSTNAWAAGPVLESPVTALEELGGALYIGTHTALYRLEGQLRASNPSSAPTYLDLFDYSISLIWRTQVGDSLNPFFDRNFCKMVAWRGSLWFWASGQVYRATGVGLSLRVEAQPVYGFSLGLALCAGHLVVLTRSGASAATTVWVNDGSLLAEDDLGWWKLDTGNFWAFPFPNAGYNQGMINALIYSPATNHSFTRWLLDPGSPLGFRADNFGLSRTTVMGQATLPLFTPEDLAELTGPVRAVQLLRFGVEWSVIDGAMWWPTINSAAVSGSALQLEYSRDGGQSWHPFVLNAATALTTTSLTVANFAANRVQGDCSRALSLGVTYPLTTYAGEVSDPGWLVRISWQGSVMPLIRRCWIDFKTAPIEALTGRVWQFDLNLNPPLIGLDGQLDSESAKSKYNRLYALWQSGQTFSFSDLDANGLDSSDTSYNSTGIYTVRLTSLELKQVSPGVLNLSSPGDIPSLEPGYIASVTLVESFLE